MVRAGLETDQENGHRQRFIRGAHVPVLILESQPILHDQNHTQTAAHVDQELHHLQNGLHFYVRGYVHRCVASIKYGHFHH